MSGFGNLPGLQNRFSGLGFFFFSPFFIDTVCDGVRKDVFCTVFRVNPVVDHILRHDERHPVMDESDVLTRFSREDDKMRVIVVFQPVESAKPGELLAFWHDGIFLACLYLSIRPFVMRPFKVPGRRDDASVLQPGIPKGYLCHCRFRSCVEKRPA